MKDEIHEQLIMPGCKEIIRKEEEQQYTDFVDKFKVKKTTDDCYTPPEIYAAIASWVAEEYGLDKARFLRPFRPGGDYQREEYPDGCTVVDNPPFSILGKIIDWYIDRGIKFFLFAPTLTAFQYVNTQKRKDNICIILIGNKITYENGAQVNTSYVTNLDEYQVRIEGALGARLQAIDDALKKERTKQLPKYVYPDNILTGKEYRLAQCGQALRIRRSDCVAIRQLDEQKAYGKTIFGGGLILSERAAAERAAAIEWNLSEREMGIVRRLGAEPCG